MQKKDIWVYTTLGFVMFVAIFLRFYGINQMAYMHDEISALNRTLYPNFSTLIEKGVKIEGHPAGVQVFLFYWTQWFGYDVWIVRLPFILLGISSVFLVFLLGRSWFSAKTGLMATAFFSAMQYSIYHGILARPYCFGLFFSLLAVWFWHQFIKSKKNSVGFLIGGVLFAAIACYMHYFCLLLMGLVSVSGFFYIKSRKKLLFYCLGLLGVALLFMPHINIFFHQLSLAGIGGPDGWLGKPTPFFIWHYTFYVFNYFAISLAIFCIILVLPFLFCKPRFEFKTLVLPAWFILSFTIGYAYSVLRSPVLQFSVLLFAFPFLLIWLLGKMHVLPTKLCCLLALLLVSIQTFGLFVERQHYSLMPNQPFASFVNNVYDLENNLGDNFAAIWKGDITKVQFVAKKNHKLVNVMHFKSLQMDSILNNNKISDLYFGKLPFTAVLHAKKHNYTIKNIANGPGHRFFHLSKRAEENLDKQIQLKAYDIIAPDTFAIINKQEEWGLGIKLKLDSITNSRVIILAAQCEFVATDSSKILLVFSLIKNGKVIDWRAKPLKTAQCKHGNTKTLFFANQLVNIIHFNYLYDDVTWHVFLWNRNGDSVKINSFSCSIWRENPVLFGLINKF